MNADVSQYSQEQHAISKSMNVYHILVQMEQPALTKQMDTNVCATMCLKEEMVRSILINVNSALAEKILHALT